MIPVPGRTKGSVCYLYQEKYLFTGDHLAFQKNLIIYTLLKRRVGMTLVNKLSQWKDS